MEKEAIIAELKELAPYGAQIGVVVRRTLAQNRKRVMSFCTFATKNDKLYTRSLDYLIAQFLDLKRMPDGILVEGVGMDMGWYIVHKLSVDLYGVENALEMLEL